MSDTSKRRTRIIKDNFGAPSEDSLSEAINQDLTWNGSGYNGTPSTPFDGGAGYMQRFIAYAPCGQSGGDPLSVMVQYEDAGVWYNEYVAHYPPKAGFPPDEDNCAFFRGRVDNFFDTNAYLTSEVINNNCCNLPGTGCVKQPTSDPTGFCP